MRRCTEFYNCGSGVVEFAREKIAGTWEASAALESMNPLLIFEVIAAT